MKNLLRNDLWMMIVAWCLEIEGYSDIAIGIVTFSSVYLLINRKDLKLLKALIIALLFSVYCYMVASVTVINLYDNFEIFIILASINAGITNEILQKERLNYLYRVFIFTLVSFVVFFLVTLFMPKALIYEITRLNTLSLIMIIFMPYTSLMLIQVIRKEYQKKMLLEKIERIAKAREFDIRA